MQMSMWQEDLLSLACYVCACTELHGMLLCSKKRTLITPDIDGPRRGCNLFFFLGSNASGPRGSLEEELNCVAFSANACSLHR